MLKQFTQEDVCTGNEEADNINSLIIEFASDIASDLTILECEKEGIVCDIPDEDNPDSTKYSDEAQDIFNIHYDDIVDRLYELLNLQLKVIKQND